MTPTVVCWIQEVVRGVPGAVAARGAEGAAEAAALGDRDAGLKSQLRCSLAVGPRQGT